MVVIVTIKVRKVSYDYSKLNINSIGVNGVSPTTSGASVSEVEQNYFSLNQNSQNIDIEVKYDVEDENIQNIIYESLNSQIKELEEQYNTAKSSNGWISGTWDWFKNTLNLGASSEKAYDEIEKAKEELEKFENKEADLKDVYQNITGRELTSDEVELLANGSFTSKDYTLAGQKLYNYTQGQQMVVDIVGDITSGVVSVGVVAFGSALGICAAPFTAGASLSLVAAGVGLAAGSGAVVKTLIKASDCIGNEKEYALSDFGYDVVTGSINGAMGPISNALGGAGGSAVMKALGCEALETTTKSALNQTVARTLSKVVNCGIDGSLSGATDGFSRALAEGRFEDIPKDTFISGIGGAVASPLIHTGFDVAGKVGGGIGGEVLKLYSKFMGETISDEVVEVVSKEASEALQDEIVQQTVEEVEEQATKEASEALQDEIVQQTVEEVEEQATKEASEALQDEIVQQTVEEVEEQATKEAAQKELLSTLDLEELNLSQESLDEALDSAYYLADLYDECSSKATSDIKEIFGQLKSVQEVSGRPKSFESTFKKIVNKFKDGKILSLDVDTAYEAVSDALGTRVQMKSIGVNEAKEVIEEAFSDTDVTYEQFIAYMSNDKVSYSKEIIDVIKERSNYVIDELKAIQNNEVYEALLNAIKNNEITITEFNNYGDGEISYFTNNQLAAISKAYYEATGEKLKIVTQAQNSEIGLIDEFMSGETQYAIINNEKAIKSSGYGSAQMNVLHELPDGSIGCGELQIRGTELNTVADVEHIPYDIRTGKISQYDSKYSSVYKVVKGLSDDAYEEYNKYLTQVYEYTRLSELGLLPSGDEISDLIMKEPKIQDFMSEFGLSDEELYKLSIEGLSELKKS